MSKSMLSIVNSPNVVNKALELDLSKGGKSDDLNIQTNGRIGGCSSFRKHVG